MPARACLSTFSPIFMNSVNAVTLLGNVARDPELKATKGKHPVCTFGLATSRVWEDSAGQRQSMPEFHSIVAYGPLAEFSTSMCRKETPCSSRATSRPRRGRVSMAGRSTGRKSCWKTSRCSARKPEEDAAEVTQARWLQEKMFKLF